MQTEPVRDVTSSTESPFRSSSKKIVMFSCSFVHDQSLRLTLDIFQIESSTMASPIDVIPTKKLEDLLECSICLGTVKDPRTLPCSHSFCKLCLERFVQGQRDLNAPRVVNTFNCPVCRCKFTLNPEEGVDGIAINYMIRNMLDLMAVEGRVSGIPCSHDCQQPSVARCVTCEKFLCKKCLDGHKNYTGFREHGVLSMDELSKPENRSKIRGKPRCKEHDDEILKYFCETCKQLICRDCRDYNHNNHECSLLKNAAEKMTEELKMRSATLTQEVEEYSVAINAMNTVAQSLEENMEAAKRRISERKQEILAVVGKMLDEREKSLVDEIKKIYHEKHEAIQQQLRATQTQANNLHQSLDVCKRLLDNEDPVEIVSSHSFVCNVQSGEAKNQKPVNHGGIPFYQCPMDDLQANIKELFTGLGNTKGEGKDAEEFQKERKYEGIAGKFKVVVQQGDITKEDTDIIVNACGDTLQNDAGVSLAIARAGGPSVQRECNEYVEKHGSLSPGDVVVTGPGFLRCKNILHAHGPLWNTHGERDSIQLLETVLQNIFRAASRLGANSIALSAISCGSREVPKDVFAKVITTVLNKHIAGSEAPFEIRLTDIDEETVNVLKGRIAALMAGRLHREQIDAVARRIEDDELERFMRKVANLR